MAQPNWLWTTALVFVACTESEVTLVEMEEGQLASPPRQLLQLSPNDSVTIHVSGDRIIVRSRHIEDQVDPPVSIYSVDLLGQEPHLLSSDLKDVRVLEEGIVLGYDYEITSNVGSVFFLDPTGQLEPTLFRESVFPTTMEETPLGLVMMTPSDQDNPSSQASLLLFPHGQSGIEAPQTFGGEFYAYFMGLTSDRRHLALRSFTDTGELQFSWVNIETGELQVIEEDGAENSFEVMGSNIAWYNKSNELRTLDTATAEERVLSHGEYLEPAKYWSEGYDYSLQFTLDGKYLVLPSGHLVELASETISPLPDYSAFGQEIGITDGEEQALDLIEDGSLMLGTGRNPAALSWSRFDPTTHESVPVPVRLSLFTEFESHEDNLFALESHTMHDWDDARFLQLSLTMGDTLQLVDGMSSFYEWIDSERFVALFQLEDFNVPTRAGSFTRMTKGELRVIDLEERRFYVLDEGVHARSVEVLNGKAIVYMVADHDNQERSGLYIVELDEL